MDERKIYSEKLGREVIISEEVSDDVCKIIMEDSDSSMVGWTHGGWNNDNGGANGW